jgi:hypothetical protein
MNLKIRKLLLGFKRLNKPVIFAGFFALVILGTFLPLYYADAIAPLIVGGIAVGILIVGGYVIQLVAWVTGGILAAAGALLSFVISGKFMSSLPYTKLATVAGDPTIVGIGWPLVRDLVNMLFIVILVFIGLATALRLGEFQAKKTLAPLIIIALLVNFTPVICGLIVDASNIVMNFFLQNLSGGELFANQWAIQAEMVKEAIPQIWNPVENISLLINTLVIITYDILTTGILLAFTLLFILRYIAIWILVILSPLAFVAYILPATRKIWSMWWNQFFQWCIIGVVAGFFLYLSEQMLNLYQTLPTCGGEGVTGIMDVICRAFPFMIVLVFMVIGFFVSLTSGAMGASQIMRGAERGGKAAGKTASTLIWRATGKRTIATAEKQSKRVTRTYQAGRALGLSKRQAFGEALKREWGRRIRPALQPKTLAKETKAAAKGTVRGMGEVAKAGVLGAFGKKPKKKGLRKGGCPTCGYKEVAADAKVCPRCGASFE